MNSIKKEKVSGRKVRLIIKTFKDKNSMYKFLNFQCGKAWKINSEPDYYGYCNKDTATLKAGVYAFAGGQWHNVKSLDASVLAHI